MNISVLFLKKKSLNFFIASTRTSNLVFSFFQFQFHYFYFTRLIQNFYNKNIFYEEETSNKAQRPMLWWPPFYMEYIYFKFGDIK